MAIAIGRSRKRETMPHLTRGQLIHYHRVWNFKLKQTTNGLAREFCPDRNCMSALREGSQKYGGDDEASAPIRQLLWLDVHPDSIAEGGDLDGGDLVIDFDQGGNLSIDIDLQDYGTELFREGEVICDRVGLIHVREVPGDGRRITRKGNRHV